MSPQEFWLVFDLRHPKTNEAGKPAAEYVGTMKRSTFEELVADLHDPNWGKKKPPATEAGEAHAGGR